MFTLLDKNIVELMKNYHSSIFFCDSSSISGDPHIGQYGMKQSSLVISGFLIALIVRMKTENIFLLFNSGFLKLFPHLLHMYMYHSSSRESSKTILLTVLYSSGINFDEDSLTLTMCVFLTFPNASPIPSALVSAF